MNNKILKVGRLIYLPESGNELKVNEMDQYVNKSNLNENRDLKLKIVDCPITTCQTPVLIVQEAFKTNLLI